MQGCAVLNASVGINSATGALTAVQGSPFPASTFPAQAAVDPTGKFLYVSNYNDPAGGVSAYTINSTSGALTAIAGSPFPTQAFGGPAGLAVHSGGKFLYVSLAGTANPNHLIAAFTIDTASGALGPVVGSPFSAGLAPLHIALDPTGKFLYAANINMQDSTVSAFTIDVSSGVLTPVSGSPFPAGAVGGLTVDSSGKFLYVANSPDTITGFNINPSNGALMQFSGAPFSAGASPLNLTTVAMK